MGIVIGPVSSEVARWPIGRWNDLKLIDEGFQRINLWGLNAVKLYLLASGAIYEMPVPEGGSPYPFFPDLSGTEAQAIWSGVPPDDVDPERVQEFYRHERAWAATRDDRPGMPMFKLTNGPPWHITVQECRSVLEIGISEVPISDSLDSFEQAHIVWDHAIVPVFTDGARCAGVMTL